MDLIPQQIVENIFAGFITLAVIGIVKMYWDAWKRPRDNQQADTEVHSSSIAREYEE